MSPRDAAGRAPNGAISHRVVAAWSTPFFPETLPERSELNLFVTNNSGFTSTIPIRHGIIATARQCDQLRNNSSPPLGRLDGGSGIGNLSRDRPLVVFWGDPFRACDSRKRHTKACGQRLNRYWKRRQLICIGDVFGSVHPPP